jgi:hypothetical protein
MSRIETGAVVVVVVAGSWVVATVLPAWAEVAWAAGVLLLLVLALGLLIARAGAMRHSGPSPFGALLARSGQLPERPADLEKIERLAGWVAYSQHDFSHRLKPMIVQLIRRRLEISKGIGLDEDLPPGVLSDKLSALISAEGDGRSSSITTDDLNRALDEIEAL